MQSVLADLRYSFRLLLRSRGYAIIAILALALGIGANTAIFSAVDAVLIRPLPYPDPDRLAMVWEDNSIAGFPTNTPAPANFLDWKKQNQVFSEMSAARGAAKNLTGDGPPEFVLGRGVLPGFFRVLGVTPALGRTLTDSDDQAGENVVVISYGLFQRRYAADPNLVGRSILMDGEKFTVVGVMPPSFHFPTKRDDIWIPARLTPQDQARRGSHYLQVVARLKPGIPVERAQQDMTTIGKRLEQEYPATNTKIGVVVVPLKEQAVGQSRTALLVVLAGAACVLLIACVNVANLLLAKAAGRKREMALRAALGAGRFRLIRQMVTESLLLSLAGGLAGLLFARLGLRLLDNLVPSRLGITLTLDAPVLFFCAAVALLTGVLFGLAPALHSSRLDLNEALKSGMRGSSSHGAGFLRDVLVVAEVALALVLLVGAGLMIRTLSGLYSIDLGFNPRNALTMTTYLPRTKYSEPSRRIHFYDAVLARVNALPGVVSSAYASDIPLTTRGNTNSIKIQGRPEPPPGTETDAFYRVGTNDYLKTLGVKLIAGRLLNDQDREKSTPVVVVNETCQKQYWSGASPLGARITTDGLDVWREVVGVVADPHESGIDVRLKCGVYLPVVQNQTAWAVPANILVRTQSNPLGLAAGVRNAIWAEDRDQPISGIQTLEDLVDLQLADRRQQMILLGSFAALALLLAALGIYGVLAYAVTQRTREIGVRMALGARSSDVVWMVTAHGARLAAAGLAIGGIAAAGVTRGMRQVLYEVSPFDLPTYAGVGAVLATAAIIACAIPAIRAARLDPTIALREE